MSKFIENKPATTRIDLGSECSLINKTIVKHFNLKPKIFKLFNVTAIDGDWLLTAHLYDLRKLKKF